MSRRRQRKRAHNGERLVSGSLLFRRWTGATLAAIALLAIALVGGLLFRNLSSDGGPSPVPKAAIVDQVSVYDSNPEFITAATDLLEGAGYAVDYYPDDQVTLGFYRNLPSHDYDLIVLRIHSARIKEGDALTADLSLFTGEPYSESRRSQEQRLRTVGLAQVFYYEGGEGYFAVMPDFITHSMRGKFDKTLIIMMGCDGLRSEGTAQAFLDKGASAFVSWTDAITWGHSDAATERLLELMLTDGLTAEEAVAQTATEFGPDPVFGAELRILTDGG